MADPRRPATRALRNLLFSVALAAAVLAALEGALRLAGWPDPGLYAGDPGSVWTLRPDLPPRDVPFPERGTTFRVRTNAAGYRGPAPVPGAVLCLGDSTTFGWGVEEDEAWPARLGARLGVPTVNGGVPGHSTVQGLATLDAALALAPRVVVLGYLVRDAERAAAPDRARVAAARPAPDLRLLRAIRTLRDGARPPGNAVATGTAWRVPPAEYAADLRAMVERVRAAGADPVLLAFPMRAPPAEHLDVLRGLAGIAPLLEPALPAAAFFPEDPIHLTPAGNDALAAEVAAALAPRLAGGAPAP